MIRILLLFLLIFFVLIILNNVSKKKNPNSTFYKKLIIALVVFGLVFILATSGRILLPQILQIFKIGLPFLTKFIGL